MRRAVLAAAVAATAVLASGAPALASGAPALARPSAPAANEAENTWVNGHVVKLCVRTPDPANPAPDPALPDAEVYLIAPVDPAHPFAPGVVIPSPPAPAPIIVAVHDTVQAGRHGPANCYGVDVLPGPRATPQTVLTRPDPNGGATLAYAVMFGPVQLDLTSAVIIKLAVRAGLLTLDHSWPGYGGTCWTGSGRH
jgi:hypothetical protein